VDDKKLQSTLKRLGVNQIPGIEEVNIFQGEEVIHFTNPRVQASIHANTYVVSGNGQPRKMADMLPSLMSQLGGADLPFFKKAAEQVRDEGVEGKRGHAKGCDSIFHGCFVRICPSFCQLFTIYFRLKK
jgi:nascent polypeptide-associated complex subunit beta